LSLRTRFLDPDMVRRLGRVEVKARQVVEGFLTGLHQSPYRGFSVEFAEHRSYVPGDDPRHIDWRVYGRRERYYIKQYHEEIEKTFQMAIDSFASQDRKLAERVVERKSEMNNLERQLHKEHLAVLQGSREEVTETSTIYLDVISDLKRINSYASGIAYAVLGRL